MYDFIFNVNTFVSSLLFVQYTDEESDVDSFQTQPWGLPVLQRSFTVSIHTFKCVVQRI